MLPTVHSTPVSHEIYMKVAILEALEGINTGQTPFGACIVRDGEILSQAHNRVWETTDSTAHAEIEAIRKACKTLGNIHLERSVIYSTCEPCPMCFSAIHWARIGTVVYGASIEDARAAGFNELDLSNETIRKLGSLEIRIIGGCLKEECAGLFSTWLSTGKAREY